MLLTQIRTATHEVFLQISDFCMSADFLLGGSTIGTVVPLLRALRLAGEIKMNSMTL